MADLGDRFELIFDSENNEHLEFESVQNKKSSRKDIHAFILLNELFPSSIDMVGAASYDKISLEPDSEKLDTLTDDQILELIRCGVMYDSENDCLFMFV